MSRLSHRTFWLVGLAGALGASGCVESDHPAFTVGWDTVFVNSNTKVSCQNAGTPTVELTMTNLSSHQKYVNKFNCEANGGESEPLPGGRYTVTIALKNKDNVEVSTQEGEFNLVRGGLTDLGVIVFEIQSFQISWSLARGPMSLRCQDVDATTVNLITRLNSEPEVIYPFPCTAGSGFTPAVRLGVYSVRPQLVSSNGTVLWDVDAPKTVTVDDSVRAVLDPVVFDIK
jgi:hypothetical protein